MYDINLIRERVIPDQRKSIMFSVISVSALLYTLTILAVVFFSAANFKMIDVYAHEIDRLQDDLSVLYPGAPTQGELNTIIMRIKPDLTEIGALIEGRTELTYMWESIARSVPDGVWVTRIELKMSSDGGRSKGTRGLFIEGTALTSSETGGDEAIREFASRLQKDPEFKEHIAEAKFAETGKSHLGGEEVIGFEIMCPFK
ncbi:PilN domain-containing protein [bacterium]|nr:PilN domain-containing protein [bacterium]